tara:strand:+ start:4065 stop:4298 length:234 start_codon:yes stop_codon:yes gene_type:complete
MRSTHLTRTLDYLNEFGSITTLEAFRDLGNTRLSSTIFLLRKKGHEIESDFIDVPTRWIHDNGDKKFTQVVRYRMKA